MNSRSIIAICASIFILASLFICGARIYDGFVHDDIKGFDKIVVPAKGGTVKKTFTYQAIWEGAEDIYMEDYTNYKFHADLIAGTPLLHGDDWRNNKALVLSLRKWAEDNKATVLVVNKNAGVGVCDYSGWLDSALDPNIVTKLNTGERGVYVSDDPSFQTAYVKDGMFMPETVAIPILGTFSSTDENLDKLILERKYIYPLTMNAGASKYTFYARGGDANELVEILKEKGFSIQELKQSGSLRPLIEGLFGYLVGVVFLAIILSTIFCFIFTFLMYYRGIFASVKVKHRFGLSKLRLLGKCVLTALIVVGGAILLFGAYLLSDINGFQMSHLEKFLPMLVAGIAALSIFVSLCGYGMLVFRLNREVK